MTSPDRERLEAKLREVEQELKSLELQLEDRPEFGHGRGSTRAHAWEMAMARQASAKARLERLHGALERLGQGDYGSCQRCGGSINPERLEILPATTMCATCAQGMTRGATGRTNSVRTACVR
jgi:RNA polymerase-binding transcription factor DksA